MAWEHDPARIATAIAGEMAALPPPRLHWLRALPDQAVPNRARTGRPRLTIVLAGERRVVAPADGALRDLRLHAGDVLVVGADGWSMVRPQRLNRIIAINCDDAGTHFEVMGRVSGSFHSGGPLNRAAWSLLGALVHLGDEPGQQTHAPALLHLTVALALADCRPWPQADSARLAWARARTHAREHLDTGRDALAAIAGVHPNHLSRLCRRLEGVSLVAWLTGLRMERARALLAAGFTAEAAARACGYAEPSHFRRTFRHTHGLPPAAWLTTERLRNAAAPAADG